MATLAHLRARSRNLRSEMRSIGLLLQASFVQRKITCGNPNCRCAKGKLHIARSVTYKVNGKTHTSYVAKGMEKEAMQWIRNWQWFKRLLKQHTSVNLAILKKRPLSVKKGRRGRQ